jgi:hypothetical protein
MLLIGLGAAIGLGACVDSTGPPTGPPLVDSTPALLRLLRWEPTETPRRFTVFPEFGRESLDQPSAPALSPALLLDANEVSFWAVRGERRGVRINYQDDRKDDGSFLKFTIHKKALLLRPDGTAFADGDSVQVTVAIDTSQFLVQLEPTGLVFSDAHPARLQIWYEGADDDLNGDGSVDDEDSRIERDLLGLWYQEGTGDPWSEISSSQSVADKWFKADLLHFSGYAVSW